MGGWNRWKKGTRLLPCGHTPSPRTTRAIPFFTQSNKATRKKRSKHETGCYCVGSAGHGPYSTIGIAKTKKEEEEKIRSARLTASFLPEYAEKRIERSSFVEQMWPKL